MDGADLSAITRKENIPDKIDAPVEKGDVVGSLDYYLGEEKIGSVSICAGERVLGAGFADYIKAAAKMWLWCL